MAQRLATSTATIAGAALSVGALTLLVTGSAVATPATVTLDNGASHYTRTVSNVAPAVGETITVSMKFERTDSSDEQLNWYKDWHPSCLTYVSGSAKVTDTSGDHPVEPYLEVKPDYIAGDFTATSYKVIAKNSSGATFSAQYTVGADCATGTAVDTGFEYLSNSGHVSLNTGGPAITITKASTSTSAVLAPVAGAIVGKSIALTATITPANAGGTVTFKAGSIVIGTAPVGNDGKATVQWTPTAAGQQTITADYSGSGTATDHISVTVADGDNGSGSGGLGSLLGSLGSLLGGSGSSK